METYAYKGYEIPIDLMKLTGGGPDTFDTISRWHIDLLQRHVGLRSTDDVVEIGCGIGRDAIPLTEILDRGSYLGIDIIKPSIDWCAATISRRHENFRFVHYDVADQLHNPLGTLPISDCRIPVADRSVDLIVAQSVFTHMLEPGIRFYMSEFARILRPSGRIFATCFVVDEAIRRRIAEEAPTIFSLAFLHPHGEGCFINDPVHPLGAVAFTASKLDEIVAATGLEHDKPTLRGNWSGAFPDSDSGQDTLLLRPRAPTLLERVTALFR